MKTLVYLAYRHIFRDIDSNIWKPRQIKQLIQQNQPALEGIIRQYDVDSICHVARVLLDFATSRRWYLVAHVSAVIPCPFT
jgi:hypothetical protein